MKILFSLFLSVFITTYAFSKCRSNGFEFWPAKSTIKENSIFVIDGYATSQEVIQNLGKSYQVYLKSKNEKVNLIVQEILVGENGVTQAVLKPAKKLSAGQTYELVIENLKSADQLLTRYNEKTDKYERVKWTVEAGTDTASPAWVNKPTEKGKIYEELGCGPEVFVNFAFNANDASEYLIKTTVKNISTNKITTYYLNHKDNIIAIGHNMCVGGFKLEGSNDLEASFTLVDASGNETAWTGEMIKFSSPKNLQAK